MYVFARVRVCVNSAISMTHVLGVYRGSMGVSECAEQFTIRRSEHNSQSSPLYILESTAISRGKATLPNFTCVLNNQPGNILTKQNPVGNVEKLDLKH